MLSDLKKCKHESASRVVESFAQSCDTEGLTWRSSDQKVDCSQVP